MRTDFAFCPGCGAKVVNTRLTFHGIFTDIVERFFNLENSLYRTLKDMTVRPERVISGYIEGIRRRYMTPMNYLAMSLAVSGISMLAMRKWALDKINFDIFNTGMTSAASRKIMDVVMEYHSFIQVLYIPVIAIAAWLALNKRKYNLPEHVVGATYTISQITFLTFPISLVVMLTVPEYYMRYSLIFIPVMLCYILFVLLRLHPYRGGSAVLRSVLFAVLFFVGYMGISILINLVMILAGFVEIEDFVPKPSA